MVVRRIEATHNVPSPSFPSQLRYRFYPYSYRRNGGLEGQWRLRLLCPELQPPTRSDKTFQLRDSERQKYHPFHLHLPNRHSLFR